MNSGFEPIIAVFYAVFHPTEGTKIVHQVPDVILRDQPSLFDFDAVRNYVIPKSQLCNKLVSFKIGRYRVMGYPVNIENADYARNSFTFNFCFVFPYDSDTTPYELAVRRMGRMFRVLEEQNFLLSKQDPVFFKDGCAYTNRSTTVETTPGYAKTTRITLSSIESLINQIYLDLNNYSECCIPLDLANSVDIKLFPILPAPVNLKGHQVPIATVKLALLVDVNWDPTMVKILPFINGINSVKKISHLADADYILTKQCLQHLLYYRCIEILDIFQFSNIYAPTASISRFLTVPNIAEECQAYIVTDTAEKLADLPTTIDNPTSGTNSVMGSVPAHKPSEQSLPVSTFNSVLPLTKSPHLRTPVSKPRVINVPSRATLFYLYRSLSQGQTLRDWYVEHRKQLQNMDVRRFITFGVLRGLIYRVHSYPILDPLVRAVESRSVLELEKTMENTIAQHVRRKNSNNSIASSRMARTSTTSMHETTIKTEPGTPSHPHRVSFNYNTQRYPPGSETGSNISDAESLLEDYVVRNQHYDANEAHNLFKLLKGFQLFDAICTELQKPRSDIEPLMEALGATHIVNG